MKHCCATLIVVMLLKVKCSSAVHTERIVAFPLHQLLHERERALSLRYTSTHFRCCLLEPATRHTFGFWSAAEEPDINQVQCVLS